MDQQTEIKRSFRPIKAETHKTSDIPITQRTLSRPDFQVPLNDLFTAPVINIPFLDIPQTILLLTCL